MAHNANLRALLADRLMNRLIPLGGMLIVLCVGGILLFLGAVALPLFRSAKAAPLASKAGGSECHALDFVEGTPDAWWVAPEGFRLLPKSGIPQPFDVSGLTGERPAAASSVAAARAVAVRFESGRLALVRVERDSLGNLKAQTIDDASGTAGPADLFCGARDGDGRGRYAWSSAGKVAIVGPGGLGDAVESEIASAPATSLALSTDGATLAVGRGDGRIEVWNVADAAEPKRVQELDGDGAKSTALAFLIGDETLVAADDLGHVTGWMRVRHVRLVNSGAEPVRVHGDLVPAGGTAVVRDRDHSKHIEKGGPVRIEPGGMIWMRVRAFEPLLAGARSLAVSPRNKCFVAGDAAGGLSVYHCTTETLCVRVPPPAASPARHAAFSGTGGELAAWHDGVRTWSLWNPHPEVTFGALFLPVWYENYPEPEIVWQSSSGTQESEPKLSLWPLVFGTLKGTVYAMLFTVPIAIAAAVYVSRFGPQRLRDWVKPSIEIMAGIPSVVVGMIAALWLAPLVERNLFVLFLAALLFPAALAFVIALAAPLARRPDRPALPGAEIAGAAFALLLSLALSALLASPVESALFSGDFRQWLFSALGIRYDLRNCFVVGVALGFAVVPIVFTIAEDSISGVPATMTSAAEALGATRWQTVRHVVLPAAASGIFAAVVLGLGRACGETMIVVMAAGNTPILDPAPWNGMRTMSAAMAIEIPEAPHGGSLYRVLFLTGLLLFAFTACLNTLAEVVGSRLQRKYGRY
jgi:phosphate transport system permease protein